MSEVALYKALVSAGASEEEAQAAVADLARTQNVVTKADLKADLAQLETRMTWKAVAIAIGAVALLKLIS